MKRVCIIAILLCLFMSACGAKKQENDTNTTETSSISSDIQETTGTVGETNSSFISENIKIGAGTEWELAGILTLPENAGGKVPAVVLVQGSGPSDMDETIYENKPFREIAEYLSSNGIAVIRYNKRTYTYGAKMVKQLGGSLTVNEETMEDAILATKILKSDPRIDENRVYILGHSLGGMLAPRIHNMGGDYAGLIIFAGSPRSLLEIIGDQQILQILETTADKDKEAFITAAYESINKQMVDIANMPDDEAKKQIDASGASLYYYKDLIINRAELYIKEIKVPMLIMQGKSDLQVFYDKDFELYKQLLNNRTDVTFKLYEGLNHIFMPSTVTKVSELLDEYKIKAHIDSQVLKDIADWIKAN